MSGQISESTQVRLSIAKWTSIVLAIFLFAWTIRGYVEEQAKTNENTSAAIVAIKEVLKKQDQTILEVKQELRAIREYEGRLVQIQSQVSSTQAGVAGLDALVSKHVHLRWNIDMMQIFVDRLQGKLKDAGTDIEMPDIQAIRAAVLFAD